MANLNKKENFAPKKCNFSPDEPVQTSGVNSQLNVGPDFIRELTGQPSVLYLPKQVVVFNKLQGY